MFNGIITLLGIILAIDGDENLLRATIELQGDNIPEMELGLSLACDGICLTVREIIKKNIVLVEISKATISVTNVIHWYKGYAVNIELPIKASDYLSGHINLGHVDCLIEVVEIKNDEHKNHSITFKVPDEYMSFISKRGSVTVNGVALTSFDINKDKNIFLVNIIPYTFKWTNLSKLIPGNFANLEIDMFMRHIDNYMKNKK
ncbi:MAG: riboflavin synthase [Anaplasmataceae bacterium]|nr:riboflavin synthase [Anaplasmataceae bacterium]